MRDCIAEYYKVYPERRPPPEVIKRWHQLPLSKPEQRVADARLGDPSALIAYLQAYLGGGSSPIRIDIEYLIEVLETIKRGESYRRTLHKTKWFQIASEVDRRVREGEKQESVIADVAAKHKRKRSTVFDALKAYRDKYSVD